MIFAIEQIQWLKPGLCISVPDVVERGTIDLLLLAHRKTRGSPNLHHGPFEYGRTKAEAEINDEPILINNQSDRKQKPKTLWRPS